MANDTAPNDPVPEKLRLFRSPLVREDDGQPEVIVSSGPTLNPAEVRHMGYRSELEDEPKLIRHDNATNLEVFYDLFLAVSVLLAGQQRNKKEKGYMKRKRGIMDFVQSIATNQYHCHRP